MDIDIRCTPHSQSAELQIVIKGDFDLKQNEENPQCDEFAFDNWYHNIFLTVTENGFIPNSGKQKTFYRSKLKTDGTSTIDSVFNIVIYPLHSETEYTLNFEMKLRDTNDNIETFTKQLNFSTQQVQTRGVSNDRNEELTLKQKQKNAIYLYNKLVKTNKYALEAFCCLLGLSDCAGNLNPTQYMIYKEFEVENANDTNVYNWRNVDDRYPNYTYFGVYERVRTPQVGGFSMPTENAFIPQKGISQNSGFYGTGQTFWEVIDTVYPPKRIYYNYFNSWFYEMSASRFPERPVISWYSSIYPPVDAKRAFSFGMFPIDRGLGTTYISDTVTYEERYNFYNQQAYLTIETWVNGYKFIADHSPYYIWSLTTEHQQQYQKFWDKYNTTEKFAKCRNPAIKDIAEFMCHCFIDSTGVGTFGRYTTFYIYGDFFQTVDPLYTIECVQKKAEYWYKFFNKRKMPLWEYLRYTI